MKRSIALAVLAISATWFAMGRILASNRPADFPAQSSGLSDAIFGVAVVAFSGMGALVISRRPGHRMGWLFCAVGFFGSLSTIGSEYAIYAMFGPRRLPFGPEVAWLGTWAWMPLMVAIILVVATFPDGHLPSRRWVVVPAVFGIGALLQVTASVLIWPRRGPAFVIDDSVPGEPIANTLMSIAWPVVTLSLLLAAAAAVIRFRRSKVEERAQMKWLAWAASALLAVFILGAIFEQGLRVLPGVVFDVAAPLALIGVPIAAGIAVLRYRLYDIDVVINKTVVYAALAAFITAIYVGVVVGIGSLLGSGDRPNLALSLAATAIVSVVFQPVRERVQRFANKLVYGERVTPYEAVTSFSHRMAESLSLDQVLPQMAEAAAKGVGGTRSRVRLILLGGGEQVTSWPQGSTGDSFDRILTVSHQGEKVGEISVAKGPGEQVTKSEDKLLQDLASQAGLAMRNLRLTGELQQKLIELHESRKRIVAAQDEERRRMERDIHDGAQQQLVSMAVKLGLANNLLRKDPQKAIALLEELSTEANDALEDLRDLARGLFPEILAERGLVPAIESHIHKMALDARVQDEIGGARFDIEVETNIYFFIREALQNASKHAPSEPVSVRLSAEGEGLQFSVTDQGPGFDPQKMRFGSGLQNMKDRIEALEGSFEIETASGKGTEVRGRIPIGAVEPVR